MQAVIPNKRSTRRPTAPKPPPFWIRALLVLTCTGVSFAHGSNDGQKGMGLIMLILIGTVPTAYALNHAVTPKSRNRLRRRLGAGRSTRSAHYAPAGARSTIRAPS
jgi:PiT family inorganic phosphate transporter